MSNYGWLITRDAIFNPEYDSRSDVGTAGPRGLSDAMLARMTAGDGMAWRCRDADGELYYEGVYLGPDDETMFQPLDDFATPNAGATSIEYRDATGNWRAL